MITKAAKDTGKMPAAIWREALSGMPQAGLFVLKACIATLLTGWLAMRFNLERPGTAMLTAIIVLDPRSGMVLAKGFYRALGTLVGCLGAISLVALFPQAPGWLLVGMALWVGFCTGGAALFRNFMSYGFLLSGYTAIIVLEPVIGEPLDIFNSAVMRGSEILLAVLITGLVNDVLFPQRLSWSLRDSLRGQFTQFTAFVRDSIAGKLPRAELEDAHLKFVRTVVEVENLRSSVIFEDAGVRVRSPRTRRLNQRFMAVSSSYQALHHLMNRLQGDAQEPARAALQTLFDGMTHKLRQIDTRQAVLAQAEDMVRLLAPYRSAFVQTADDLRRALPSNSARLDFDTGAELAMRVMRNLERYAKAYTDMANMKPMISRMDRADTIFAYGNDWLGAGFAMLRSTLAMLAGGVFWMYTSWDMGGYMMLSAAVFCGIVAGSPNPMRSIRGLLKAYIISFPMAIFAMYGVMIHMDGFLLFAAGLLPFLIAGFYLYTRPKWLALGKPSLLMFMIYMEQAGNLDFDFPVFFSIGLAFLFGILLTAVAFMLLANAAESGFLFRHLRKRLRLELSAACRGSIAGARQRLESTTRDLFMQIMGFIGADNHAVKRLTAWTFMVNEVGHSAIDLRQDQWHVAAVLKSRVERVLSALNELSLHPDMRYHRYASHAVSSALLTAKNLGERQVMQHLHILRLALKDEASVWHHLDDKT